MFRKATRPSTAPAPATQVTVTDTAPCQKTLRLQVGREIVGPVRAAVLAEFQKEAALPGFRKGKAPADLVERHYAKPIQEETLHRVTQQALEEAVKTHELKPIGPFEVAQSAFTEADGLTFEATVEVEPSFALGRFKGIALTQAPIEVTAAELEQAMAGLQESMAQLVPAGESQPKTRQVPTLDDEFAKDMGFQTLEQLKGHLDAKLREQKRAARQQALESAACDELLKRHAFEVPPRLVSRQTERLTRDFAARLLLSGMPEAQVKDETVKFTQQLRTSAERHVKLAFILDRIAAAESVAVSQDELVSRLWQVAQRWKKDPADVRKVFDTQGLWPSVVSTIRQEKTLALVLAAAAIDNGTPATHQS